MSQPSAAFSSGPRPVRVLFVCLGNICRSPLAEGVFRAQAEAAGLADQFHVTSAGTGDWHIGNPPDARMIATAASHGLDLGALRGEQVDAAALDRAHHVFVMDKQNLQDTLALGPEDEAKIRLFREFDPQPDDYQVPDPYFGDGDGFERVYDIVERTCAAILGRLRAAYGMERAV